MYLAGNLSFVQNKNMNVKTLKFKRALYPGFLMGLLLLAACNGGDTNKTPGEMAGNTSGDDNTLLGAGSTFIYPLFSKLPRNYGAIDIVW